MKQTLIKQGINYSAKNVSFIALGGKGLWWLKSEAYPQLLKELDQADNSDERPTAVFYVCQSSKQCSTRKLRFFRQT